MINCHELIEFCLDYLEGELPQEEEPELLRALNELYESREALSAQIPVSVRESIRSFLATRR